jgi:hypothetical protein
MIRITFLQYLKDISSIEHSYFLKILAHNTLLNVFAQFQFTIPTSIEQILELLIICINIITRRLLYYTAVKITALKGYYALEEFVQCRGRICMDLMDLQSSRKETLIVYSESLASSCSRIALTDRGTMPACSSE